MICDECFNVHRIEPYSFQLQMYRIFQKGYLTDRCKSDDPEDMRQLLQDYHLIDGKIIYKRKPSQNYHED
jgi:hypothetical protein